MIPGEAIPSSGIFVWSSSLEILIVVVSSFSLTPKSTASY